MASGVLGILSALTAALVWGSADFSGGVAARRSSQFQVLVLSAFSGIVLLAICALVQRESFLSWRDAVFAGSSGIAGTIGLAALYRALATGNAASAAPMTAVISASLPVLFGILTEGMPTATRLAGFALAIPGIGLVSASSPAGAPARLQMALPLIAGMSFGAFFILLGQVSRGLVFTPLIVARIVMLCIAAVLVLAQRQTIPGIAANPIALLAGMLDAGGNIFFLFARHLTRLDAATVLSSLYPAVTVLWARLLLKEQVSTRQWVGGALCMAAITLIAL